MSGKTREILGAEADSLLNRECRTISREMLHLPGPLFVDNIVGASDRSPRVLRNLWSLVGHGPDHRRKAFQKSVKEGVELLHAVPEVYLDADVTIT